VVFKNFPKNFLGGCDGKKNSRSHSQKTAQLVKKFFFLGWGK
jgi:hypothetical protein